MKIEDTSYVSINGVIDAMYGLQAALTEIVDIVNSKHISVHISILISL